VCNAIQDQMPPKGPSVEVVVLEDYGEVAFSIGKANLQKGESMTHLMRALWVYAGWNCSKWCSRDVC